MRAAIAHGLCQGSRPPIWPTEFASSEPGRVFAIRSHMADGRG